MKIAHSAIKFLLGVMSVTIGLIGFGGIIGGQMDPWSLLIVIPTIACGLYTVAPAKTL